MTWNVLRELWKCSRWTQEHLGVQMSLGSRDGLLMGSPGWEKETESCRPHIKKGKLKAGVGGQDTVQARTAVPWGERNAEHQETVKEIVCPGRWLLLCHRASTAHLSSAQHHAAAVTSDQGILPVDYWDGREGCKDFSGCEGR